MKTSLRAGVHFVTLRLAVACAMLMAAAGPAASQAVVFGIVVDDVTLGALAGAEVLLTDAAGVIRARAASDAQGAFMLRMAESGTYSLSVSRVRYAAVEGIEIRVDEGDELELEVQLAPEAVLLDPVTVVAARARDGGFDGGFQERAERSRRTGRGRIYTREEIARIHPASVRSLIDGYAWGSRCRPGILLNGIMIEPPSVGERATAARATETSLFGIRPNELEGLELYRERDQIPSQYHQSGMCGLALVWTRVERTAQAWSWRRVAIAGLLMFVTAITLR